LIKTALATSDVAYGTWAQSGNPEFGEIAARAGMDFVIVDMEHGSFGIETAVSVMRGIEAHGAAAMLRVPDASRPGILKVLDAGASALLVPNVSTAETAQAIVDAARYAPLGKRGACPCTRATSHGVVDWQDYVSWSKDNLLVGVLVETPEGLDNYEAIVSTKGIDFIGLGPFDLSQALGFNGDWKHPDVIRRQEEMVRIAREKGVEIMAATFDSDPVSLREQIDGWRALGVRMFAASGDRFMLASGYRAIMSCLRGDRPADARRPATGLCAGVARAGGLHEARRDWKT
jgi:4-hydroxy-2-oxoheptanedioate aldolase